MRKTRCFRIIECGMGDVEEEERVVAQQEKWCYVVSKAGPRVSTVKLETAIGSDARAPHQIVT